MVHHGPHADRNPSRLEKLLAHPGEAWRMAWPGMEYIDIRLIPLARYITNHSYWTYKQHYT